jgi:hypothetical protein
MAQYETFKTVTAISFSVDYIENFLLKSLPLTKSTRPVVSSTTAVFRKINVFWVVELEEIKFKLLDLITSSKF